MDHVDGYYSNLVAATDGYWDRVAVRDQSLSASASNVDGSRMFFRRAPGDALVDAITQAYVKGELDHLPQLKALVCAYDPSLTVTHQVVERLEVIAAELEARCEGVAFLV
jgi:hypothetical protein